MGFSCFANKMSCFRFLLMFKMSISKQCSNPTIHDGLVLTGYHKKLKTMKKKYFALYKDTEDNVARLEYYDNEKKFKYSMAPKRTIKLKNCFSINQRLDTRHDFVIALSTKDGSFGIVMETKTKMLKWLEVLVSLQRGDVNSPQSKEPQFVHVWQVTIVRRGLAEQKGLFGNYFVGLTSQSLAFIRIGSQTTTLGEPRLGNIDLLLNTIRRCGDSQCYFYIEVGRQSVIGPGEFWVQTEDVLTAQNMHSMILNAMTSKTTESTETTNKYDSTNKEPMRKRSSSANEASKPIIMLSRRQNHSENKINNSPQAVISFSRERCDSLPTRNRTSSDSQSIATTSALRNYTISGLRSHSYQRHSNSPPMNATIGCSESEESSVSIDEADDNGSFLTYRFNSRSSKGVIPEENTDDLLGVESKSGSIQENIDNDMKSESVSSVGNNDDSYLSMAPVYSFKENNKKPEEPRYANSVIEFPEFVFDKASKITGTDVDSQFERPTRAYSIGSKTEHVKINKRPGNLNDFDNTMRVRAFSVGSRAKIPRCDLQRGVLYPKSLMEHNCNSNNNICSLNDSCHTPHHILNTTACSEKKSTSAPILIHKSQNSVDRMSDLMEIDFSKPKTPITNTNASIRINAAAVKTAPIFKSAILTNRERERDITPTTTTMTARHESMIIKPTTTISNIDQSQKSFSPIIEGTISHTDNGYLEMKPVGDTLSKSSPAKHFKDTSNLYSASNAFATNTPKKVVLTTVPENKNININTNINAKPYVLQTVLQNKIEKISGSVPTITDAPTTPDNIPQAHKNVVSSDTKCEDIKSAKSEKELLLINNAELYNRISSKVQRDQVNRNILSAKYAQLAIDAKSNHNHLNQNDQIQTQIQTQNQIQTQIQTQIQNQNQKQIPEKKLNTENVISKNNDDYINIKQKTNEQISAKLKNQSTTNANTINYTTKDLHERERDCVKLTHSISDEDNKYDVSGRKSVQAIEGGYEILQIKSDSSLQANKSLNRLSGNRKDNKNCQLTPTTRPRSTNNTSLMSTTSSLCGCTSSSTSCLNYPSTPRATIANNSGSSNNVGVGGKIESPNGSSSPTCKVNNASNTFITTSATNSTTNVNVNANTSINANANTNANTNANAIAANNANITTSPLNAASRPPSVSSEHELHYASLDLPPSTSDISVKFNKMDITNGSSPVAELASANNSYAKIHFDLSDTSSSSLQNVNVNVNVNN